MQKRCPINRSGDGKCRADCAWHYYTSTKEGCSVQRIAVVMYSILNELSGSIAMSNIRMDEMEVKVNETLSMLKMKELEDLHEDMPDNGK